MFGRTSTVVASPLPSQTGQPPMHATWNVDHLHNSVAHPHRARKQKHQRTGATVRVRHDADPKIHPSPRSRAPQIHIPFRVDARWTGQRDVTVDVIRASRAGGCNSKHPKALSTPSSLYGTCAIPQTLNSFRSSSASYRSLVAAQCDYGMTRVQLPY